MADLHTYSKISISQSENTSPLERGTKGVCQSQEGTFGGVLFASIPANTPLYSPLKRGCNLLRDYLGNFEKWRLSYSCPLLGGFSCNLKLGVIKRLKAIPFLLHFHKHVRLKPHAFAKQTLFSQKRFPDGYRETYRALGKTLLILAILSLSACKNTEQATPQFQLLTENSTGLHFDNTAKASTKFNVFNYMYFFNGGGVAAGDFNQDGKVDLYFTANMSENKLFLNQGNLKFKDVTKQAQLGGQEGWTTGCSVVDINNDGRLDIYVSQLGNYEGMAGTNQLYVCTDVKDGIPVFEDKAAEYGLDLSGLATQAVFFDYDLDGDLDMFQLNHTLHQNGTFGKRKTFKDPHKLAGDRLLRNDKGKFTDVTNEAGILSTVIGYGLGIVAGDINLDGYPDLYIGNDFHENDYLYINQQNGTFKEVLTEQMMHTSRFSMGVDMADLNNDGWSEILSLDMLPADPYVLKTSLGEDGFDIFKFKIGHGYNHQYARNNLQLNNGNGTFSEIAMFAGVHATDWSWAGLFTDFDYDGYKDIFISNGIPRRMNDIDYVNFRLGDADTKFKTDNNHLKEEELSIIEKMPKVKLENKFFRNNGDLTFTDIHQHIKNDKTSYSNGAAYADLDNDGDLDIVTNNIEDAPFVYKNMTMERTDLTANYLAFQFEGSPENRQAIGARIVFTYRRLQSPSSKEKRRLKSPIRQIYEHYPVRGYQSSMAPGLSIGVGEKADIENIKVIWSDGTFELLNNVKFNETNIVKWKPGLTKFDFKTLSAPKKNAYQFEDMTNQSGIDFQHEENPFVEFNRESLIPHMVSSEGPALAVGDVNGDQLEDIFIGSAKRRKSALFLQQKNGTFRENTPAVITNDSLFEDVDAVLVDIENDGDLDLVIASGGNEYRGKSEARKQRAYLNDGKGNFQRKDVFPDALLTASCILPADYNGDGLIDFFIGGRAIPYNYGKTPKSYLYKNKGNGEFEEVIDEKLNQAGLVKDGTWYDMDGDGDQDLVLAIEWQPIQIFTNNNGQFEQKSINNLSGWWNFVLPHDFDNDGDVDILAGNLGTNARLKPTKEEPIRLYVNDFDDNQQVEQILTYYLDGKEIPFNNHAELIKQMVGLKKKYLYAKDLAKASMTEIFGKAKLQEAEVLEVNYLQSAYFENTGEGFKTHPLPAELQFSTLEAARLQDLDKDGKSEVILGGNFYDSNIEMGRYDASYGHLLSIGKNGKMEINPLGEVVVKGQTRRIKVVNVKGEDYLIFGKNGAPIQVLKNGKR